MVEHDVRSDKVDPSEASIRRTLPVVGARLEKD